MLRYKAEAGNPFIRHVLHLAAGLNPHRTQSFVGPVLPAARAATDHRSICRNRTHIKIYALNGAVVFKPLIGGVCHLSILARIGGAAPHCLIREGVFLPAMSAISDAVLGGPRQIVKPLASLALAIEATRMARKEFDDLSHG
jgi:hypothetical protein